MEHSEEFITKVQKEFFYQLKDPTGDPALRVSKALKIPYHTITEICKVEQEVSRKKMYYVNTRKKKVKSFRN